MRLVLGAGIAGAAFCKALPTAAEPCAMNGSGPTSRAWWAAGRVNTTPAATEAPTTTAATRARCQVTSWRRGGVACAATRRTRSRSSGGATGRASRSVRARSGRDIECLRELLQRAVQARRAVGGRDAEHACCGGGVELEHDPQRDHLALAGGQVPQRRLDLGREPFRERLVVAFRHGRKLLAAHAAPFGAEVIERDGARDLTEPRARRSPPLVEAVPQPQGALERLSGQVFGDEAVAGEPGEVPVNVVEVPLSRLREGGHTCTTPPGPRHVTPTAHGGRAAS